MSFAERSHSYAATVGFKARQSVWVGALACHTPSRSGRDRPVPLSSVSSH